MCTYFGTYILYYHELEMAVSTLRLPTTAFSKKGLHNLELHKKNVQTPCELQLRVLDRDRADGGTGTLARNTNALRRRLNSTKLVQLAGERLRDKLPALAHELLGALGLLFASRLQDDAAPTHAR